MVGTHQGKYACECNCACVTHFRLHHPRAQTSLTLECIPLPHSLILRLNLLSSSKPSLCLTKTETHIPTREDLSLTGIIPYHVRLSGFYVLHEVLAISRFQLFYSTNIFLQENIIFFLALVGLNQISRQY